MFGKKEDSNDETSVNEDSTATAETVVTELTLKQKIAAIATTTAGIVAVISVPIVSVVSLVMCIQNNKNLKKIAKNTEKK